ncbi:protein of unknown function DUF262 [Desulfurispirillum indicum S5]|uniref:DUF262 domain-containing protein n=1 Tax=Desulfurispirillum indicum (strain ATCC BAA-1389 / DSM 22839 / S5) TaxID=653733 RepID=E6W0T5_DESIS|nr:DUF262 domain-containing protein [Desulfurispirillum indicum]ADU66430.1 protein of unknown function DUF262 [Desulfurispirillum indicum S5]
MNNHIDQLSVQHLLEGDVLYRIPMYQRNYAWDEGEITQLIQDVIDYSNREQHYYIGTLVVFERPTANGATVYETIDGQQRLTTLSLLVSFLKNEGKPDVSWYSRLALDFECREHSQRTFSAIFANHTDTLPSDDINSAILNGYRIIQKVLPQKLAEHNVSEAAFSGYLFEKVQIMRVTVPHDTDLNHYFEIMNNRGEQLEKHEVLKSRLLEVLNRIPDETERTKSKDCFHRVWEACANMEKYVQAGFAPEQRHELFGRQDWGQFLPQDFDDVQEAVAKGSRVGGGDVVAMTLTDILSHVGQADGESSGGDDEVSERFNSVINFPNFLLHVLRVSTGRDIPLDDKRLIAIFEEELLKKDDPDEVKEFGFALLKCKFLYDHYILKREFIRGTDGWSLKRYKWSDGGQKRRSEKGYYVNTFGEENGQDDINRRILMLLAAFHVSTPTLVYKHWLNAALSYLFRKGKKNQSLYRGEELAAGHYLGYLKRAARAFVFDRFLGGHSDSGYYQIIYDRYGKCKSQPDVLSEANLSSRLSFGEIENNLVFNYLDYLLWLKHKDSDPVIKAYEFTFRSSVEHYYPQNPLPGHDTLPADTLNSFGNLCLISHSKNSRLSNFMPQAKKEYYRNNTIDSIKQYLMMNEDPWDEVAINQHYQAMREVFRDDLDVEVKRRLRKRSQ